MSSEERSLSVAPKEIFAGVLDGLFAMNHRCHQDGFAFWTSGYESDRQSLCKYINRHQLPMGHPDRFEAPHVGTFRRENLHHADFMRRDIVALLGKRPIPKEIRRAIHELPKES
ncbi:hypothetical protein [Roseimicrobium sp. ORNL1]|uniref:hypothetical protein n=1 Tax=Roseimicrobium sp. ORNL1 TaxID=2711231 RepID=UPI0013E1AC94|nr:hypothetical protein [Roseimicrobium sp. ORNL1]QIF00237.1 hypothetical protein G5S37_01425 [Roseimicrobium sp. ORNL1]